MQKTTLEQFFTRKFFTIPSYQRDYAWVLSNIDDLFEDIQEAIETATEHYIGTFILSKQPQEDGYKVVDGQQRLTTLTILLNAIIRHLPDSSQEQKIINRNAFIQAGGDWRLSLLGDNAAFFQELLQGRQPHPDNQSQRMLQEAYNYIENHIRALVERDGGLLNRWLECVKSLLVMEFIEEDEGRAIRIFQTVNDRGVPLSNMEKAKSLLIYYSNRFLNGALDEHVNDCFGKVFRAYSQIKDIATDPDYGIQLLKQDKFNEDSVMRYHYLALESDQYNYNATADYVLEDFLKGSLRRRRTDLPALKQFIESYGDDLATFFVSLNQLVQRVKTEARYYKLFCVLNLSATLYPLVIRLSGRGLLDQALPESPNLTFADLIERADVRVYKTRGTDPARDASHMARDASRLTPVEIERRLFEFVRYFMNDSEFKTRLGQNMYENQALNHIFIEYDEWLLREQGTSAYDLEALKDIRRTVPQIEHMFPQTPEFDFPNRGFASEEDYIAKIHTLGNLTLLERSLNSACRNRTPEEKVNDDKLYKRSRFRVTKRLLSQIQVRDSFVSAEHIAPRTEELAAFCLRRWALWR